MNKIVRIIVSKGIVAYESDYLRKAVVNAFICRSIQVYKTNGYTLNRSFLMPEREGWGSIPELSFYKVKIGINNI